MTAENMGWIAAGLAALAMFIDRAVSILRTRGIDLKQLCDDVAALRKSDRASSLASDHKKMIANQERLAALLTEVRDGFSLPGPDGSRVWYFARGLETQLRAIEAAIVTQVKAFEKFHEEQDGV